MTATATIDRNKSVKAETFVVEFNRLGSQGKSASEIAAVLGMNVNSVLTRASTLRKKGVPLVNLKRGGGFGGGNKLDVAALAALANGAKVAQPAEGDAEVA